MIMLQSTQIVILKRIDVLICKKSGEIVFTI